LSQYSLSSGGREGGRRGCGDVAGGVPCAGDGREGADCDIWDDEEESGPLNGFCQGQAPEKKEQTVLTLPQQAHRVAWKQ
jgi:hypothetical protein